MGRSYWFECSRCGYRVSVSGRADRGVDFWVQTIHCRDCKTLYDAVVRLRLPDGFKSDWGKPLVQRKMRSLRSLVPVPAAPPTFQAALNRLPATNVKQFRWVRFAVQCPVSRSHRVDPCNNPRQCPRCGLALERNVLPYRIWE